MGRLKVIKQPIWDWDQVGKAIHFIVRSTGYCHKVEIAFPVDGAKVEVLNLSSMRKIRESSFLMGASCLSCAWICLLPMYLSSRKRLDCITQVSVDYKMKMSPEDFYQKNYWPIFFRITQGNQGYFKVQV